MLRPDDDRISRGWLVLAGGALLAGAAIAASKSRRAGERPFPMAPERSRTALVGGVPMRWEEHGDSRGGDIPIVLVHGLPTNPRAWRYVIPRVLRAGVRCLAWELVGFGRSLPAGLGRDLSMPAQAEYLRRWLRHQGIERAVFIGHDFGGGVLQHLAVASPGLFAGLVLTDSVAFDNWPVSAVRIARALRPAIPYLPPPLVRLMFRAALANLGHVNSNVAAESVELFWAPYRAGIGAAALAHQLSFFDNRDTMRVGRRLKPLDCPSAVVWGEHDPLGMDSASELARRLDADLLVIPGGYHFTIEDHPDAVADAVLHVTALATAGAHGRRVGAAH